MRYEIVFSPEAYDDLKRLSARDRTTACSAIETHLRFEPGKTSKSRIKRLRGMSRPEYRLRVGEFRIYYDIKDTDVEILAIIPKSQASNWLDRHGETA
jgi:mRNA-degrading endonuclease RelE of RelBE toxin-antitoxin system